MIVIDSAEARRRAVGPPVVQSARQRALLELADGERNPCTIAHLLGRPAFHVLVDVRRLAAAGLVGTPYAEAADQPAPLPTWLGHAASVGADGQPDFALLLRLRDLLEARL